MAVKAICKVNFGVRMQQVFVSGQNNPNKKEIETYWMPIESLPDFFIEHSVEEVSLSGHKAFIEKIKRETRSREIAKYSNPKIKFTSV